MAENKTKPTKVSPRTYVENLDHKGRREDAELLLELFEKWTGYKPQMWGPTMIGYGRHGYQYESGRTGEIFAVGFAPRKANMVFYIRSSFKGGEDLLAKLGNHKKNVGCMYVGRLSNIDLKVLEKLVKAALRDIKKTTEIFPK